MMARSTEIKELYWFKLKRQAEAVVTEEECCHKSLWYFYK